MYIGNNRLGALACLASVALVGSAIIAPQSTFAKQEGPFALFSGAWRGTGHVAASDGQVEPINCRANYDVSDGGTALSQSLVCASDSYRFDIHSSAVAEGRTLTGNWQETTRNVGGPLTGDIAGGDFEGSVSGAGFTASVSLRSNGRIQVVEIQPQATSISKVNVTLRHGN
jgi:hypothetical protein